MVKLMTKDKKKNRFYKNVYQTINKTLITVVLTLILLIGLKTNNDFKNNFYDKVYDNNFSFAKVNNLYQKYFGSPLPFEKFFENKTTTVFNEKLKFQKEEEYKEGVKLTVTDNYLVPNLESGMVIFIGEKEGYGNTVIVEQANGIDIWYGNINNLNVTLYDYVEKGKLLGEVSSNELYLVYKKEGKVLDYKKYI